MGAIHKGIYQALWEEGEMGLSRKTFEKIALRNGHGSAALHIG